MAERQPRQFGGGVGKTSTVKRKVAVWPVSSVAVTTTATPSSPSSFAATVRNAPSTEAVARRGSSTAAVRGIYESPRQRRHERSYFSRQPHPLIQALRTLLARPRSARSPASAPNPRSPRRRRRWRLRTSQRCSSTPPAGRFTSARSTRRWDSQGGPASIARRRNGLARLVRVRRQPAHGLKVIPAATLAAVRNAAAGTAPISAPRRCAPSPPASAARTRCLPADPRRGQAARPLRRSVRAFPAAPRRCARSLRRSARAFPAAPR